MSVLIKICGITSAEILSEIVQAGATHIGLVFCSRSPRFVTDAIAREIALETPHAAKRVGLFVDPHDDDLEATLDTVPLDMVQLHGNEAPDRVREIKNRYRLPVIKALKIGTAADLDEAAAYEEICDWLLFDAPTPAGSNRSGGNGIAFSWPLLAGRTWNRPWMLSGGLTAGNVAEAIRLTGATAVDVSSGVESSPGIKDAALVRRFIAATIAP